MALQSKLFRGEARLEAALVSDSAHILQGAVGSHVGKIQQALNQLDGAGLNPDEHYGPATARAVLAYKQKRNIINRSYQTQADNIVGKMTMARLDAEMVEKERRNPEPAPDADGITAAVKNAPASSAVTQRVAAPVGAPAFKIPKAVRPAVTASPGKQFRFTEFDPKAAFDDLLIEVTKGGRTFWVGASVPKKTTDFTRAQLFFAPSTIKHGKDGKLIILANDKDYKTFTGGWADRMRNFVPMIGVQAAAAKKPVIMMITYMRSTGFSVLNDDNVFKDRPVQTLNVVMNEIKRVTATEPTFSSIIEKLGVSSFSSGVSPMRTCIEALKDTGLIKEVFNFDGPFLVAERKVLTTSPGAVSRVFTQHHLSPAPAGWVNLIPEHFQFVTDNFGQTAPENIMHQRIGRMLYNQALENSIV